MPRRYPAEFRRKVLDLVAAGRPVAEVAAQLGVSGQTIYNWRNQELAHRRLTRERLTVPAKGLLVSDGVSERRRDPGLK